MRNRPIPVALIWLLSACGDSHAGTPDGSILDAPPLDDASDSACSSSCGASRPIDFLLVVQDHSSFRPAIQRLVAGLPPVLHELATDSPFPIHLGVVSGDMGVGPATLSGCTESGYDGVLRGEPECSGAYTAVSGEDELGEIGIGIGCRLVGEDCHFSQPLEAVLKATTPSESEIVFASGAGHASGANRELFRPDGVLAVLFFVGDNDCSTGNPEIYDPESTTFTGALNLRCFDYAEELQPVTRYVDGLSRSRAPEDLVFFIMGGIPPELDGASIRDQLESPAMEERLDPRDPGRLDPACSMPGLPVMNPPRRLLSAAETLATEGAAAGSGSACLDAYDSPLRRFAELVREAACACP